MKRLSGLALGLSLSSLAITCGKVVIVNDGSEGGTTPTNTGGSGGFGGAQPFVFPECQYDTDCEVRNDCCDCVAAKSVPACDPVGCAPSCGNLGLTNPTARCIMGLCRPSANCDPRFAQCDALPPACESGWVPSIDANCWGPCVDPSVCLQVPSCEVCTTAGRRCAAGDALTKGQRYCFDLSPSCGDGSICDCLGGRCTGVGDDCHDSTQGADVDCPLYGP